MTVRLSLPCVALLIVSSIASAADPQPRPDVDARVAQGLAAVLSVGVPMYKGGDREGCARLYHGGLLAVKPLLDHRPDLQTKIQARLDQTRSVRPVTERAFAMRAVID